MKTLTKVIIGLGALAVLAGGCTVRARGGYYADESYGYYGYGYGYVEPQPVYVNINPPRPYVEVRTAQPASNYTWIDGYWHWSGSNWTWFRGRWEAPRQGYAWVGPSYVTVGGRYQYVPGYWSNGPRVRTVDSYPNQPPSYGGGTYVPPPSGTYAPPRGTMTGGGNVYVGGTVGGNLPPPSGTVTVGGGVYAPSPYNRGTVVAPPPSGSAGGTVYTPGTVVARPPVYTGNAGGTIYNRGTVVAPPPSGTVSGTIYTGGTVAPPPSGGTVVVPGNMRTVKPYPWKSAPPPVSGGNVVTGGTVMTPGSVAPPPGSTTVAPASKGKARGKVKWNFGR